MRADLVEEVARVIGYDNLPMTLPHVSAENIVVDLGKEKFNECAADLMIAQGFNEVVSYALMSAAALSKIKYAGPVIKLQNPMSAEQEFMRPTALGNLLQIVAANMNRSCDSPSAWKRFRGYCSPRSPAPAWSHS